MRTQNPLVARPCGFDSLLRHQMSAEGSMRYSRIKKLAMGLVAPIVLWGGSTAAQKKNTFSGEFSDRYCVTANSHEMMM